MGEQAGSALSSYHYHILVNPVSGHGKAPEFIQANVVPLLESLNVPYTIHTTTSPRDAGRIGQRILTASTSSSSSTGHSDQVIRVIVGGGDGTAHEMIEGVAESLVDTNTGGCTSMKRGWGQWELSILPLGTANALFHSLFPTPIENLCPHIPLADETARHSLTSLLLSLSSASSPTSSATRPRRLPISITQIYPSSKDTSTDPTSTALAAVESTVSHIVVSTSLHAALLSDSEALRDEYPGVERFKVAAAANLGVFFDATAVLIPLSHNEQPGITSVVQFDPHTKTFVPPFTSSASADGSLSLDGPFTYFLSSATCPRLEQTFVVAPTLSLVPPSQSLPDSGSSTSTQPPTMDIIVARPLRDAHVASLSSTTTASSEGNALAPPNEAWSKRVQEVFGAAYKEGEHVYLTYPTGPDASAATSVLGDGDVVVEVFRCGGFEWTPARGKQGEEAGKEGAGGDADKAKIVCADGSLHRIPEGGYASVQVLVPESGTKEGFWVCG